MTTSTKSSIRLTRRVAGIRISPTIAVMNRAQELIAKGVDVVDFGPGEPDFPTPSSVAAAGKRAIDNGLTKYTSNAGTKALRDAIAVRYQRRWSARDAFLLFDETYEFFVYHGAQHVSAMRWYNEHPETVITVNSMSKTFAMTGWRLGFAIGNPSIVDAASKIQSHSTSNPSSIS